MLHEWGLSWAELVDRWTDEQLAVYLEGLVERMRRRQQERETELRVLLAAMGAEIAEPPQTGDVDEWVRRIGGAVEVV